jgi:cytidylate kinase
MGSVVFPDADLKVFLTARVEVRAERRLKQLMEKGITATIRDLTNDLLERDQRDASRKVAPLCQCPDALLLDTSAMSVQDAVDQVVSWFRSAHEGGVRLKGPGSKA